jgi:hypothetical protein
VKRDQTRSTDAHDGWMRTIFCETASHVGNLAALSRKKCRMFEREG